MSRWLFIVVTATVGLTACRSTDSLPARRRSEIDPRLFERPFLNEVLRYVYRWHFDESYFLKRERARQIEIWIRALDVPLDEGDRSQFAEMWLPAVHLRIELKRADYQIPEMNLKVEDKWFKITRVERLARAPKSKRTYRTLSLPSEEVVKYLFDTRSQSVVPDERLRARMGEALLRFLRQKKIQQVTEPQVFYAAPISPVCNELWVFWENRRALLQFSADMDLSNPGFWSHLPISLDVFSLDDDVVVSTEEVPGSNAFVTKDWVGRALYNCIVLGEKRVRSVAEANEFLRRTTE